MTKRRVVVTGLGMLSPLGLSVDETWRRLLAGISALPEGGRHGAAWLRRA